MAYYIKPPRGYLSLAKLEILTWQRYHFLLSVLASGGSVVKLKDLVEEVATVATSDGLIEGSQKDAVSHFMLRLACCQDPEMEKFLINTEAMLFSFRFSCMNHSELLSCIKPLRRLHKLTKLNHSTGSDIRDIIHLMDHLSTHQDWSSLLKSYLESDGDTFVSIPFQFVLGLVKHRHVVLKRGVAEVPCNKISVVFTEIFNMILQRGILLAREVFIDVVEEDLRINKLLKSLKVHFGRHHYPGLSGSSRLGPISCEDVDRLSDMFPLCMAHAHRQLQAKHRLRHHSRIRYTLFLKELGLPVSEALHFWRKEYSQPRVGDKHSCEHSWEKDGRRYTYSIRHLYGLEGARVNYRGHCCTSIQNHSLAVGEDGGCPFKHFDREHLLQELLLDGLSQSAIDKILNSADEMHCYNDACRSYMLAKLGLYQDRTMKPKRDHTPMNSEEMKESGYDTESDMETPAVCQNKNYNGLPHIDLLKTSSSKQTSHTSLQNKTKSCDTLQTEFETENETWETLIDAKGCSQTKMDLVNPDKLDGRLIEDCSQSYKVDCSRGDLSPQSSNCCIDHEECPPSQTARTPGVSCLNQAEASALLNINKPIDYLTTYKSLLDGLR